jgi:NAD(P)-dependent dehydrogenase (short-subunit alcohol dehydrogenase family)
MPPACRFTERSPIEDITPEHFDKSFNLMARAPVFLVQKLLPLMTRKGPIILVTPRCTRWALLVTQLMPQLR